MINKDADCTKIMNTGCPQNNCGIKETPWASMS